MPKDTTSKLAGLISTLSLKGRMQCSSMQIVMNKCFLFNPEKNLVQSRLVVFEKMHTLILKNDVSEPKTRLL